MMPKYTPQNPQDVTDLTLELSGESLDRWIKGEHVDGWPDISPSREGDASASAEQGISQEEPPDLNERWRENTEQKKESPIHLSQFLGTLKPPKCVIYPIVRFSHLYTWTGRTGHAKTAVLLSIALSIAKGESIPVKLEHEKEVHTDNVKQGNVLYLVGENPDDTGYRLLALCEAKGVNPEDIPLYILPRRFPLSDDIELKSIQDFIEKIGGVNTVIIDTSAAYSNVEDENDNAKQLEHARRMRLFLSMAGDPAVMVACHPSKSATESNMEPRGGSSLLAEVDGNIVNSYDHATKILEVTNHEKFRGPPFQPLYFELQSRTLEKLKDERGRPIYTVIAIQTTIEHKTEMDKKRDEDLDNLKSAMTALPTGSMQIWGDHAFINAKNSKNEKMSPSERKKRVQTLLKWMENKQHAVNKNGKWELTALGRKGISKEEKVDQATLEQAATLI
jgi:hypothetical protein